MGVWITDAAQLKVALLYLLYFCLPPIPFGASREERDVSLLHVGMPWQEGCYRGIASL